jgi:hypothetical protein
MPKLKMSIIHKICKGCLKDKPISEFNKNSQFGKGINSKCKDCVNKSAIEYYNKFPWRKTFYVIKDRCTRKKNNHYKNYGERGILVLITSEELKTLWFRDKAYLMKQPSINRKDNNGNYTLENCEYIEWGKNSAERNTRILSKPILQYDKQGNFIKEWKSLTEIANALNGTISGVSSALNHRNRQRFFKGFDLKYK